eukprot:3706118-Karenia_brevis.AAC.1
MSTKVVSNRSASITSHVHDIARSQLNLSEAQQIPPKQFQPYAENIQKHISGHFELLDAELNRCYDNKNTDDLWK